MPDPNQLTEQERLLGDIAAAFVYPPTPELAPAVLSRLAAGSTRSKQERPGRLALFATALAVAGLAMLAATVLLRDLREAVADFLGLAVENERIEVLPTPLPGVTPTPFPTPQSIEAYATPIAAAEVATRLGFAAELPRERGLPRATYVTEFAGGRALILQYDGFDLWESRESAFEKFVFSKSVAAAPLELTINGRPAYWISGAAHIVRFIGSDGKEVAGSQRTVLGNTLVWRGNTLNYRLEVDTMSLEEAREIAESLP